MAIKRDIEIDDIYRNINGITLQMQKIAYVYSKGKDGLSGASAIFKEACKLQEDNPWIYKKLLWEAETMIDQSDYIDFSVQNEERHFSTYCASESLNYKRSKYQEWLVETGMVNTAARNYGNWLNKIDSYAMSNGYSGQSVYEIENVDEILSLYNSLCLDSELIQGHKDYFTSLRKYISYRSDGTIQLGRVQTNTTNQVDVSGEKRAAYQEWLVETGMASTAARNYGNWLNKIDFYAMSNGFSVQSVYEMESVDDLLSLHNDLFNDQELLHNHRDYFTSLRKYITYRRDENASGFIAHKEISFSAPCNVQTMWKELMITESELDQYSKILCDNFEEGLVINAIRLDKFRMFYEDEFGVEPTSDDDELIEVLKSAGTFVGDRIFPKHDDEQSDLIGQIVCDVVETLKAGARCVYLSCVLSRWRQELADQLNIYNQETLCALIQSQNVQGLVLTDYVLKLAWKKVYPEENVVECLKEVHKGVNYQYLQRKIWYIPLETIKRTLVTAPEIVLVDAETYFYAPNFPATPVELYQLTKLMNAKIDEKGFLVSKDIYDLIHSGCHSLAINTEGYKDWAYRNILKYLLRDEFEFSGSVVSLKGQKLEMYQVYKDFCRGYKHLTVNQLDQFSHELGVQIYWESVLTEMIRINANELVNRNQIHFDVEAIDIVLDEMCPKDYIPIKDVGLFLHFPAIEVPWNSFVLESYLLSSDRFSLYHASFSKHEVYGVLIRKYSHFENYEEVIVDLLANSNEWTNAQSALQLIVEKGCQARRRWKNFDKVLQKAITYREELEQKEV